MNFPSKSISISFPGRTTVGGENEDRTRCNRNSLRDTCVRGCQRAKVRLAVKWKVKVYQHIDNDVAFTTCSFILSQGTTFPSIVRTHAHVRWHVCALFRSHRYIHIYPICAWNKSYVNASETTDVSNLIGASMSFLDFYVLFFFFVLLYGLTEKFGSPVHRFLS